MVTKKTTFFQENSIFYAKIEGDGRWRGQNLTTRMEKLRNKTCKKQRNDDELLPQFVQEIVFLKRKLTEMAAGGDKIKKI